MAQNWTVRVVRAACEMGRVLRAERRPSHCEDADARRIRSELDALRARFPDHA